MGKTVQEIVTELRDQQMEFEKDGDAEKLKKAIGVYTELLNDYPDEPLIIFQLATAYLQLRQFGLACQLFRRATWYLPDNTELWSNLGCCYRSMQIIDKAKECFAKSLGIQETAETLNNMSACYINEGGPAEGIPYAIKAIELQPDNPKPKWNWGLLNMEMGNWKEGWQGYECGFFCGERMLRNYTSNVPDTTPFWDGTEGQTVIVWDEQGLGDRILASNLLRKLEGKVNVILECHDRLEGMYKRSFPWIEKVYPTSKKDHIEWVNNEKFDAKIAIASLAKLYWSDGEFDRTPYIKPDPEKVKKYRERFEKLGKGPYIGFTWHGGARKTNTKYRSLKLAQLQDMMKIGGTWFSLQYHEWAKEKVERMRESTNLPVYHFDENHDHNYDEVIAMTSACDLVVTVCNTTVHVCGATGTQAIVMVPRKKAWRYPDGEFFPWYGDHIKQVHAIGDDWEAVLSEVKRRVAEFLK